MDESWTSKYDSKDVNTSSFFEYTTSCETIRSTVIEGVRVKIIRGMIVDEKVDVIVN